MRYGGHQTFPVREGWLAKAIEQIEGSDKDSTVFAVGRAADALGVGSNMANSIEHWLLATGLAEKRPRAETNRSKIKYDLTPLGKLVFKHDPYFTLDETWWLLHINLINTPEHAATWNWFYNYFPDRRFDKAQVVARLSRWESQQSNRNPSPKTLERDVTCFLNTYARSVPKDAKDPEEDLGSPFQELRLLNHLRASGTYEVNRHSRAVQPEVLLYSIVRCSENPYEATDFDISFSDLARTPSGPLQAFVFTTEDLFDAVLQLESAAKEKYRFSLRGLAGDRQLSFRNPGANAIVRSIYSGMADQ